MLSTLAYSIAFSAFQFGKAAAVCLVMGLFGSVVAFFYTWFSRKEALA
jgi:raffinose/stachyose/melibiose transport system permease protein